MNSILFESAQNQYKQGAFDVALNEFTRALQDSTEPLLPGELGKIYHQIGNCLMHLGNQQEAIQAYVNAMQDSSYGNVGSLNYNIGVSYASLKDFENASKFFDIAVTDEKYDSRYKAFIGLGTSLMKLGKGAEAGIAFREAALDASNPDPTKALLNLGICFMSLNRPLDAVTSYESALCFDMNSDFKNKLQANLGQAYVAVGKMKKAVQSFEECLKDGTYKLSDSASVDYQKAISVSSSESADKTVAHSPIDVNALSAETGAVACETVPVDTGYNDTGFTETGNSMLAHQEDVQSIFGDATDPEKTQAITCQNANQFQEWPMDKKAVKLAGKQAKKLEKQQLKTKSGKKIGFKVFLVMLIIFILLACCAVATFLFGLGFPPAKILIEDFYNNPQANIGMISDSLNNQRKEAIVNSCKGNHGITIDSETSSFNEFIAYVTMKNNQNKDIHYKITLKRNNVISWKISDVSTSFASKS